MLFIEIARFVVRGLKARFRDQKSEFDIIRRHLRPGDIVCDIGANKGSFVLFLSRWCRGGRVVASEPQPAFAARLAAVCRAMKLDNVTVEAKAVFSHSARRTCSCHQAIRRAPRSPTRRWRRKASPRC